MVKCGLCEIPITPKLGSGIPGYLHERRGTGVKDDLFAKAIVLETAETTIALVSLDVLDLERDDVIKIRERAYQETSIPKQNIMVCTTHTHTGSPTVNSFQTKRDSDYLSFLIKQASDVIVMAYRDLKPARIGYGLGYEEGIAFNRRFIMKDGSVQTNPGVMNPLIDRAAGPIDPQVVVLKVCDLEDKPIGIISNFACHLDVVGGTEYSADYAGELSKILKKDLGSNVVSIFLTGASGNINHINVHSTEPREQEHYKKMGRILADQVLKVILDIQTQTDLYMSVDSVVFSARKRGISRAEIELAQKTILSEDESETAKIFASEVLEFEKIQQQIFDVEVQAIKIGDLAITALPGDVFVEFGLDIKKDSPFKYNMISTHSNGRNGYIATIEAFEQGGYETRTSRTNKLEENVGYEMVKRALEILKS